jgi:hypothetical protein
LIAAIVAGCAAALAACTGGQASIISVVGVSPDGLTIQLEVASCNADLQAEVAETPQRVIVRVFAWNNTRDGCSDGHVVELKDPLGNRSLIDASTGAEIDVPPIPGEHSNG